MELNRSLVDQIMMLYDKKYDADTFNFDMLTGPHIYQIVPPQIVEHIHQYIINPKYAGDTGKKIKYIDNMLRPYGLVRFAAGTNRAVYRYMEDQTFCVKVALDEVGLTNNPDEFKNQQLLKPFVNKIFSVSVCGTFATCERVIPIRSRQEFAAVAGDIFDVIANKFIGKYLLEDIGTIWFKNWGVRGGFGPVLLDYPYLYEVDINRLFCNAMTPLGLPCGGQIDYDAGFNILFCTRCGKRHKAKQIGKAIKEKLITYKGGNSMSLKIVVKKGNKVIVDKTRADNHIDPNEVLESQASTTMTRVIPKGGNTWNKEDFDIIITINGVKYGKKNGEYTRLGQSKAKAAVKTNGAKENPYRGICTNVKPREAVTEQAVSEEKPVETKPVAKKKVISMGWFNTRPETQIINGGMNEPNFGVKISRKTFDNEKADKERADMIENAKKIKVSMDGVDSIPTENSTPSVLVEEHAEKERSDENIKRGVEKFEEMLVTANHFGIAPRDFIRTEDDPDETETKEEDNFDTPDISDF